MVKEAQEEIARKAIVWCQVHELEITVKNIVCALDNLGLLVEGNLTQRAADDGEAPVPDDLPFGGWEPNEADLSDYPHHR